MLLYDQIQSCRPLISFEIFPPKQSHPENLDGILSTVEELYELGPDFISVTYGAGGSTKSNTVELASLIKNEYHTESLAHLTCVASTKTEIDKIAHQLIKANIQNVLVLRGDFPEDPNFKFPTPLHYHYAEDLTKHLATEYNFCLGGAFYPEGHIESKNYEEDLHYVKQKAEAGLDFLISQLFYDNAHFYHFRMKFRELGGITPLIAGIMPLTSISQIKRISKLSGCTFPKELLKLIDKYKDSPKKLKEAGIHFAVKQVNDLIAHGVDGIHIYTMNKPEIARRIVESINI